MIEKKKMRIEVEISDSNVVNCGLSCKFLNKKDCILYNEKLKKDKDEPDAVKRCDECLGYTFKLETSLFNILSNGEALIIERKNGKSLKIINDDLEKLYHEIQRILLRQ